MSPAPNVSVFENPEDLARAAAERFIEDAQNAIGARGHFSVALAGGSTPRRVYELLGTEQFKTRIVWPSVHIFFGDERCVPPDHPYSNYRMVWETLISRVPIPRENVHRMMGEGDAIESARLYEEELKRFFDGFSWPRFDLVLLGMGVDGHTASLFPGTKALHEKKAWVTVNFEDRSQTFRITLTAPAINHAAHVMFLITGLDKSERVAEVMRGPLDPARLPAQLIQPEAGSLVWFLDKQAASRLD